MAKSSKRRTVCVGAQATPRPANSRQPQMGELDSLCVQVSKHTPLSGIVQWNGTGWTSCFCSFATSEGFFFPLPTATWFSTKE